MDISSPQIRQQKPYNIHQLAPPAWSLKGEAWWLILSLVGKLKEEFVSLDEQSRPDSRLEENYLGPGHFDLLEGLSRDPTTLSGIFRGGMGTVQIIRYHSSPVGPYDELLMIPGEFSLPEELGPSQLPRVTRIYVSTLQSVLNGRYHWNIPKHLAHFEFTPGPAGSTVVNVYALRSYTFTRPSKLEGARFEPIFSTTPFFSTIIQPWGPTGVRVPMRLSALPGLKRTLAQPPLKEGDIELGMISTNFWKTVHVDLAGRVGLCKVEGGLEASDGGKKFGDGKCFPDFKPYRIGINWKDLVVEFPEAQVLSEMLPQDKFSET